MELWCWDRSIAAVAAATVVVLVLQERLWYAEADAAAGDKANGVAALGGPRRRIGF